MGKSIHTERQKRLVALLRTAREKAGLTQIQLSRRLGKYRTYVSKYETGERQLDVVEFIAVAEALGLEPGKVLGKVRG
ncbi:MAG: helix-turn-helix transcriptional regulator [Xanthobacteraceae bacterium]